MTQAAAITPERFRGVCHATAVAHPFAQRPSPKRAGLLAADAEAALPLCTPSNEAELADLLALARADGLACLAVGGASKLGLARAPERLDFLISTTGLQQVVAFEPGDGTLTAQGGARIATLASLAASGARDLVPRFAPSHATLGGAIATGAAGLDRLRRGPLREHVLGLRVMLADGTVSKSGGRLVKNVAGYDLHRLHLGAWGGLGIILEATLRLFPLTRERRTLAVDVTDPTAAIALAQALFEARLEPERVHATLGSRVTLHATFAGRPDVVQGTLARAQVLLGDQAREATPPPQAPPAALYQTLPSRAAELLPLARELHAATPSATLTLEPLIAQLHSSVPLSPELASAHPALQTWPRIRRTQTTHPGDDFRRALEHTLDPERTFTKLV